MQGRGFTYQGLRIWFFGLDLGVCCSPHPFCFQYLMRGRVSTYHGLCIRSLSMPISHSSPAKCLTLPRPDCFLPLVLILCAFGILYGGEFYLSRFTNLILWLCYLDLGVLCSPRLQSSPSVFHAGESIYLPIASCAFNPADTMRGIVF